MNGEEDFRLENTEETERSQYDFCVLLLDSDATCLVNLSEMLRKRGYRVVATTRADEVPLIINNKDEKIDLLLAESRLIEMNKYQLLDEIRSISEIPVVVAGANVDNDVISDGLCRGVQFYMKKPLMESDLDYLSQFIISIRRQQDLLTQSLGDELNQNIKNMKGEKEDLDEYKGESVELGDQKMPDLTCPEMQNEFKETDDDQLSQGKKRKDNVDTDAEEHAKTDLGDLGDQKKPKLVRAGDLQNETSGDIPNEGEANNEGKEPTEIKKNEEENVNSEFEIKEKPEMVSMEGELEKWSTQPITDLASYGEVLRSQIVLE